MAVYENVKTISLDLNTGTVGQYKFVKISGADGECINTTADTDVAVGIAMEAQATVGGSIPVAVAGVAKIKVTSGTVTRGGQVTSHTDGGGKAAVSGDEVHGVALSSAANGDIIDVLLAPSSQLLA